MSGDTRLADIVSALHEAQIRCLVMGGHAVRFYGLTRYTNDYDLHLAPEIWDDLSDLLPTKKLLASGGAIEEGPSWRPRDFRRFRIGTLPDGQEEWLEFWRGNHLLAPFPELYDRREEGLYGGGVLPFLSLSDLIRSKETERDKDWSDIAVLEEIHDARLLRRVAAGELSLTVALAQLRCRRGLEAFARDGRLTVDAVIEALRTAPRAVTQALLLPFAPSATELPEPDIPLEPVVLDRLRKAAPNSTLHFALVEIARRQRRQLRQTADRADKEAIRDQPPSEI